MKVKSTTGWKCYSGETAQIFAMTEQLSRESDVDFAMLSVLISDLSRLVERSTT